MAFLGDPIHLLAICVLISLVKTVSLVSMLTPSGRHSKLLGETLVLGCEFRAGQFDLFNNPVIWKKQQHHEDVPINIQGTINQPFADADRFRVRFIQTRPVYRFELFIDRLTRADNGNYTCEVRGGTRVIANVSHEVIIKAPVEHVFITNVNQTHEPSPAEIVFTENIPGTLRCVSHGGYPAPDVQVTIGETDIGDLLSWTYTPNFEGPKGLRALSYTVERWSHSFLALADFDGKEILCAAVVPGLPAQAMAIRIRVNYLPQIVCDPTTAYEGERNVTLSCLVTSRPRTMSVKWLTEDNGSLSDVMSSTAYWSTMRIIDDRSIQATLHISQAGPHRFKKYLLEAKNSVGVAKGIVNLLKGRPPPPTTARPLKNGSTLVGISGHETGSHYIFIISASSKNTFQTICLLVSIAIGALFHLHNTR